MVSLSAKAETPDPEAFDRRPSCQAEDAIVQRFFMQFRTAAGGSPFPAEAGPDAAPADPRREFDAACELLDRASRAFETLAARCLRLERDLDEAGERAHAQATAQGEAVEQLKRLASTLRAQARASDQAAASSRARCEAAEARATAAESHAAALEAEAAQAAHQTALAGQLREKVVAAFGLGSRVHPVIETMAPGERTET